MIILKSNFLLLCAKGYELGVTLTCKVLQACGGGETLQVSMGKDGCFANMKDYNAY